ncbi:MAG: hypothetical protein CMH16_24455 [Methylobacterium sp.]|nr:hypothetical protein [Methylobacterium sp.]
MTGVDTIARIRFEHHQNGEGIKRIARELGIAPEVPRTHAIGRHRRRSSLRSLLLLRTDEEGNRLAVLWQAFADRPEQVRPRLAIPPPEAQQDQTRNHADGRDDHEGRKDPDRLDRGAEQRDEEADADRDQENAEGEEHGVRRSALD